MSRSRINTQQKILQAVEDLLLGPGFGEVGINAIARQAGCDKVLIYRYFGGFDGLLQAFAESRELWWQVGSITDNNHEIAKIQSLEAFLETILKRHIAAVSAMPLAQEIMAWELSAHNALTTHHARLRAERGRELVKTIRRWYGQPSIDIGGMLGVFGAAINYLIIRTRNSPPEHAREEWWRLEQTLSQLLNAQAKAADS